MSGEDDILAGLNEAADLLDLAASDPRACAARLREMAGRMLALADALDAGDTVSPGGIGDRVMARVTGPDGQTRQYTDTARGGHS
jgi:hypothetical protein